MRPFFYFIGYIMESFNELITKRRSTRKFTAKELTQDEVVILLKAALKAPASKRSNPWQFVLVDDKELLRQLAFCKEQSAQFIADAALAVVVMADPLASDVWIDYIVVGSLVEVQPVFLAVLIPGTAPQRDFRLVYKGGGRHIACYQGFACLYPYCLPLSAVSPRDVYLGQYISVAVQLHGRVAVYARGKSVEDGVVSHYA